MIKGIEIVFYCEGLSDACRCTGYSGIVVAIRATLADSPTTADAATAPVVTVEAADRVATEEITAHVVRGGGTELSRSVAVALPPDDLWRVLSDIERVAACLPGVTLTGREGADRVTGRLVVAVGPIKASFEGKAQVRFDAPRQSGTVTGAGQDRAGRSAAHGEIRFAVAPDGQGSRLDVTLDYSVTGLLAQFSRGALVSGVVAQLLDEFAGNLIGAAKGQSVSSGGELGAFALLRRWLARLFARRG